MKNKNGLTLLHFHELKKKIPAMPQMKKQSNSIRHGGNIPYRPQSLKIPNIELISTYVFCV